MCCVYTASCGDGFVLRRYLPESQLREMALVRDPQVAEAVNLALDRPRYDALLRPPTPAAVDAVEEQVQRSATAPSVAAQ